MNVPAISFARSDGNLVLIWPTNFILQAIATLSASNNWSKVTALPTVSNNENTLTIDATSGKQFFRLIAP